MRSQSFVGEALGWLPDGGTREEFLKREVAETPEGLIDEKTTSARVVVADDNADMRDYVGRLLGATLDVELVANGRLALEAVRRKKPDLVSLT